MLPPSVMVFLHQAVLISNALEIDGGSTATHSKAVSAWDWMGGRDGAAENTVVYLCLIG